MPAQPDNFIIHYHHGRYVAFALSDDEPTRQVVVMAYLTSEGRERARRSLPIRVEHFDWDDAIQRIPGTDAFPRDSVSQAYNLAIRITLQAQDIDVLHEGQ